MGVITWIVLGAIAGFIAEFLVGGSRGLVVTVIVGIVGALIGGFLAGSVLGVADVTGLNLESILVAVLGSIILIMGLKALGGSRDIARG